MRVVLSRALAGPTVAAALASKRDHFGLIRLLLAIAVVVSHSKSLGETGLAADEFGHALTGFTLGEHAVNGFFAISGFLIAMSWDRRRKVLDFLASRVLRLVPGLLGAILFTTFILGPLVTTLPVLDYLRSRETWTFLSNILLRLTSTGTLPGVFSSNPLPIVMGTVWTLKYEIGCYLGLFVLGVTGLLNRRWPIAVLVAAFLIVLILIEFGIWHASAAQATGYRLRFIFAIGTALYVWRDWLRFSAGIAATLLIATMIASHTGLYAPLLFATEAYAILYCALSPTLARQGTEPPVDLSYGTYLYGMPVQQALYGFARPDNPYLMLPAALAITALIAWGSWHLIEAPALRLKTRLLRNTSTRSATLNLQSRSEGAPAGVVGDIGRLERKL